MPTDAPYDQLLRLLSVRSLQWLRNQIDALPVHMPLRHPAMPHLAQMAEIAPALGFLGGRVSPLQTLVARRFTAPVALHAARRMQRWPDQCTAMLPLIVAGRHVVGDDAVWRQARDLSQAEARGDLPIYLALMGPGHSRALARAEAMLGTPIPPDGASEARIDLFARTMMQVYGYGMWRPAFARRRSFGVAYTTCLGFAEWAARRKRLIPMAQMAVCLRLIDPGHDVAPLLAEIIPHQRPDGSFPVRMGYGTDPQDLDAATTATLMTALALHMALRTCGQQTGPARLAA